MTKDEISAFGNRPISTLRPESSTDRSESSTDHQLPPHGKWFHNTSARPHFHPSTSTYVDSVFRTTSGFTTLARRSFFRHFRPGAKAEAPTAAVHERYHLDATVRFTSVSQHFFTIVIRMCVLPTQWTQVRGARRATGQVSQHLCAGTRPHRRIAAPSNRVPDTRARLNHRAALNAPRRRIKRQG